MMLFLDRLRTARLPRAAGLIQSWRVVCAAVLLLAGPWSPPLSAAEETKFPFDIPASDAPLALKRFSSQSGKQLLYSNEDLAGVTTNEVHGDFTAGVALAQLLANTPLVASRDEKNNAFAVGRERAKPAPRREAQAPAALPSTPAANEGSITGVVSNAATKTYLERAQVSLQPGGFAVLTERDGGFTIPRVPAGEYTLLVDYAGLDQQKVPVKVAGNTVTRLGEIPLSSGIYQLSRYVVEGEREGNALAIQQQKTAPNLKNIVSSDAFGSVADLNLGNFLLRLPGFSPEVFEGQIVRVQIRGTNSNLNAFSIDGTRAANGTTSTFNRSQDIDRMSADFIETIEVSKAATPDIDADSIGGAVNMKTKSPLDRKGQRISYNYGYSYNPSVDTFRPAGTLGYSNLFMDGKVGVLFTASYSESNKPRDQNLLGWQNTIDKSAPAYFYARGSGLDALRHQRGGLSGRVDYKFSDDARVYFSTSFTNYRDQLNRRWVRVLDPGLANILSATGTVTEAKNLTFQWLQTLRNRDVNTFSFTLGGEMKRLWGGKLDWNTNYSPSRGTDVGRLLPTRTISGVQMRQELVGGRAGIRLTQTGGPDIYDWRNSTFTAFDQAGTTSNDNIFGAQANYERPFAWRLPVTFKTGLRYRRELRDRDNSLDRYNYVGPNGVVGPVGVNNDDNLERFLEPGFEAGYHPIGGGYPSYAGISPLQFMKLDALEQALAQTPQFFSRTTLDSIRDSIRTDNKVTEQVSAAYLQASTKIGPLGILGGVRLENTRLRATGYKQEITPAEKARRAAYVGPVTTEELARRTLAEFNNPVESTKSYTNFFPSIHFKYNFTENLVARASFSTGIGRPNFGSIVPTYTINNDTQTISATNPALKPQFSDNYDVALEYYFRPAGVISAGVFEKKLTDFIYRLNGGIVQPGNEYGEAYNDYQLSIDQNGGNARVRGLELAYQQNFQNLPGRWRGLGAFANATFLKTEGDYNGIGVATGKLELANFTPLTVNAGISYIFSPITIRVLVNYTDRRLVGFNASPALREITFPTAPVDLKLAYAINRRLNLWCDIDDLFNEGRQDAYYYDPNHKSGTAVYSTIIRFGVSGNF